MIWLSDVLLLLRNDPPQRGAVAEWPDWIGHAGFPHSESR
jgi:hypothetical protein